MKKTAVAFAFVVAGLTLAARGAGADDYMQLFSQLPQIREVQPDSVYLEQLNKDLDRAIADLKAPPLPPHRALEFGAQLNFAHSAYVRARPLEVLTIDVYLLDALPAFARMARTAREKGKGVYIEETCRFAERKLASQGGKRICDVLNQMYEDVDQKWLKAMVLFATTHDMEAVTAFHTTCFFLYVSSGPDNGMDPAYNKLVLHAILEGKRTETFRAFQSYARDWGAR